MGSWCRLGFDAKEGNEVGLTQYDHHGGGKENMKHAGDVLEEHNCGKNCLNDMSLQEGRKMGAREKEDKNWETGEKRGAHQRKLESGTSRAIRGRLSKGKVTNGVQEA